MSKKQRVEKERIQDALVALGGAVSIEDVEAEISDMGLSRAQVRARLASLEDEGTVRKTGRTRGTRYEAVTSSATSQVPHAHPGEARQARRASAGEASGFFSAASMDALESLARPIHMRPLARYEADWVIGLSPSDLLSPGELEHLEALGRTDERDAPAGTYARQIFERLIIDLSWASSNLEGNTYTLLDTQRLLSGQTLVGKDPNETQMILNHKRAIELLVEEIDHMAPNSRSVCGLHATLMENLLADPRLAGRVRHAAVRIGESTYTPLALPQLLEEAFATTLAKARRLESPLRRALFLLAFLSYLQPFIDGNKRTARLATNIPLLRHNMRPLSFVDVPRQDYLRATLCLYEQRDLGPLRELFIWAYERSCVRYPDVASVLAPPDPFRQLHRDSIYELVRRVVSARVHPAEDFVEERAHAMFEDEGDAVRFTGLVLADLEGLHPGNLLRYRLRERELDAWRALIEER